VRLSRSAASFLALAFLFAGGYPRGAVAQGAAQGAAAGAAQGPARPASPAASGADQSAATPAQTAPPGAAAVSASALILGPEDLRIEQLTDGGYHVYVRRKPGLGSVLLTESTKDPARKADSYAYRAAEWNPVNGDERRILDGAFIPPEKKLYSIIDSSPEPDPVFGEAYHLFIPWVVEWGYAWSRNGRTFVSDGSFVSLRAFALPYADYRGAFADNPYLIRVTQKPRARPPAPPPVPAAPAPPPPRKPDPDLYMPETVRAFEGLAEAGKGEARFSEGEADIVPVLSSLLDRAKGKSVDLVVCLDTTDSMKDDIDAVKRAIPEMLKARLAEFSSFRLGFVLYKDYFEDYLVKKFDFTREFSVFTSELSAVRVAGGRDIPEAVYEALYTALVEYPWAAERKMIVLIGDAPPHPLPRGTVDRALVEATAARLGVEMDAIILPH